MKEVAQKHLDQLDRIKEIIQDEHDYFEDNYRRYNEFRRFVFETSLTPAEITLLQSLGKPQLEFNILEAYVSRLLGEFSKQEPDIEVGAYDEDKADPETIEVVQSHLKHVFMDADNEHLRYEIYKDLLSGGFSAAKVYTEYEHPMSMDQVIKFVRCEPTMVGFDKSARFSHKGDGQYCFELFPRTKKEFEQEYPDVDLRAVSFKTAISGFNWAYKSGQDDMIVVGDYYEKKIKQESIARLSDGRIMTMTQYKKLLEEWTDFTIPPVIEGKPRKTSIEKIVRYRFIDNTILEYEETDFDFLPIVFIDGNSLLIKSQDNSNIKQMTRPYVYHAMGAQRLKNFAGISIANNIENQVEHKFMVAKEAMPKESDYLNAYKDVQRQSVLVFNSVHENNPEMPIMNPIREVQRIPAPPEIAQCFTGTDSLIQNILGSYDASLGINNNQLSGVAIVEAATQSNGAAMPYIVGCLQGMQRLAQIYVNLMPKYMVTPRTIPIRDKEGKRKFIRINGEEGMQMEFDTNSLNVSLKAGASFQVQKSRTINMVKEIMGISPLFQSFMAEKGLGFILDNMEGKGIEELKDLTGEWVQQYNQEKQAAQQQAQQEAAGKNAPNPMLQMKMQLEAQKMQHEEQKDKAEFSLNMAKLELEKEKMLMDAELTEKSFQVQMIKSAQESERKNTDLEIKKVDVAHKHLHNAHKLRHEVNKTYNESMRKEK